MRAARRFKWQDQKNAPDEIGTFAFEAALFLYGRIPAPFVVGMYAESFGFQYF